MKIEWIENPGVYEQPQAMLSRDAECLDILEQLASNPGKWAIVLKTFNIQKSYSYASRLRKLKCEVAIRFDEETEKQIVLARKK